MTVGLSSPEITSAVSDREVPTRHRVLLLTVARGDARFCIRLGDLSEVGRVTELTRMDGARDAVLGSMVLHAENVPVIDVAVAIGVTCKNKSNPKMFAATCTEPAVCIALDEIICKHEDGEKNTDTHPHDLVDRMVAIDGRSLPLINIHALSQLAEGAARPYQDADTACGIPRGQIR